MLDKFSLTLENNSLPINVKSYSVRFDMFEGSGTFWADIDPTYLIDPSAAPIKCQISINDQVMFLGYVEHVDRSYSKGSLSQTIQGRDMMQVLIDNYIMQPHVYPGVGKKTDALQELFGEDTSKQTYVTLHQFITDLWNSSKQITSTASTVKKTGAATIKGIQLTLDRAGVSQFLSVDELEKGIKLLPEKPGAQKLELPPINFPVYADNARSSDGEPAKDFKIAQLRSSHGDNLFQLISQACNSLGLFLYCVPGTHDIIIHKVQTDAPVRSYDQFCNPTEDEPYPILNIRNNPSNNVISCSYTQDSADFYKFVRLIGQTESEDAFNEEKAKSFLIIDRLESGGVKTGFQGVTRFKCNLVNVLDSNVWYKEQDKLVANEFMQQARKLYQFRYTLSGHSRDKVNPYFFNHAATVSDDMLGIKDQTLLVNAVEYNGSKEEGQTTTLSLYSPSVIPGMISAPTFPQVIPPEANFFESA